MDPIDEYMERFDGEKREWLHTFVGYMRKHHPEIPGRISYQMPMFKFDGMYVAFSAASDHFTFHTLDFDMIEELKSLLPKAKFGKGSAKVPYDDRTAVVILFSAIEKVIGRNR
ncbi:iron chaperone [Youngiibacter multivorans]|uniref:Uncharacterized protein YdhG (YjbR/CyaY superfamily) n=1 Tax=Youngiibacter multivorans TaxID=937251 RepID=A0ABS4G487_9CLOT|nr:DUF1801 domain-containing protein [Youngiibacter multivorans]MBP1919358.1 uncharacterized protein YdhG (YjbR/CyaY superfamily) [Youngiibacter multivorans]